MSSRQKRWQRIEALFKEALGRSPEVRAAWLRQVCGDDVELRREVEELLAADAEGGGVLEGVVRGGLEELQREQHSLLIGQSLGPYRIEHLIGRGGTSTVFLAERSDGSYEKKVAVKLLQRGMETPDLQRRFEIERRILAALDHPNIARLLDAGTTGDGQSYFVMEYVEGEPLHRYCDGRDLTLRQRLELFAPSARRCSMRTATWSSTGT